MSNDLIIKCLNEMMEFRMGYNIQCILRNFYDRKPELYESDKVKFYEELVEHLKYNRVAHSSVLSYLNDYTLYIQNGVLKVQFDHGRQTGKFTPDLEELVNIVPVLKGEHRIENWFGTYLE